MDRTVRNVSDDDVVLIDVSDRFAVVTLNRPDTRNALNPPSRPRCPRRSRRAMGATTSTPSCSPGPTLRSAPEVDLKSLSTDSEVRHVVASDPDA